MKCNQSDTEQRAPYNSFISLFYVQLNDPTEQAGVRLSRGNFECRALRVLTDNQAVGLMGLKQESNLRV